MKAGTLFVALVVAGACISGIVWLAGGGGGVDVDNPKSAIDTNGLEIADSGPYPKAVLPESMHDFDVMAPRTDKSHTFRIKNEGEVELKYKLKGTTCSCTVSDMEIGKIYTIAPGEEAEVDVKWTPPRVEPEFMKEAQIYTNDPKNPLVTFTVKGRVEDVLTVYPEGGTWKLTNMTRNQPKILHGEIFSAILDEFSINSVETSNEKMKVTYQPISQTELEPRRLKSGYTIIVEFTPDDLKIGEISETVTVHTDVEGNKDIVLTMSGQFMGSITGLPYLPDGVSADGRKWVRQILHTDLGQFNASEGRDGWYKLIVEDMQEGAEFEVSDIESSNEFVTATVEPLPAAPNSLGRFFLVTFHVKPGIAPGGYDSKDAVKVTLKTNHQYAPEIKFILVFQAV